MKNNEYEFKKEKKGDKKMPKEKSSSKRICEYLKKHKKIIVSILFGIVFSGAIIGVFAIINCCVSKEQKTMWLDGGAWVELVVGSLGAVTTAFLGYVAVWQNKKAQEVNQKLAEEQLIAINKSTIIAKDIICFEEHNIFMPAILESSNVLKDKNMDAGLHGVFSSLYFNISFSTKQDNVIEYICINDITVYYDYANSDELGSDKYPGCCDYAFNNDGGYCKEKDFKKINDKYYHTVYSSNDDFSFEFHIVTDFIMNDYEYKTAMFSNIQLDHKISKFKEDVLVGKKLILIVNCVLLNSLNIATTGFFEFYINIDKNHNFKTIKKRFVPTKFDYFVKK